MNVLSGWLSLVRSLEIVHVFLPKKILTFVSTLIIFLLCLTKILIRSSDPDSAKSLDPDSMNQDPKDLKL
jgi:hypothetical protein